MAALSADSPHSRRSVIRSGLAALAGVALGALGRPSRASAAAGGPILMGAANDAAGTNTSLTTITSGTAFQVSQNGPGTAVRGIAGKGIAGFFTSADGSGVSGVVGNSTKFGVYGSNDSATSNTGAGVRADGKQNAGVIATSSGRNAVKAIGPAEPVNDVLWSAVRAEGCIGVFAISTSAAGGAIEGASLASSGATFGVQGTASSPSGYGIFSQGRAHVEGNLSVTGTVSKGGGSFKIDHPLDPANRYLYHSFVESPDMLNVYSGTATLDKEGEALVALPDWFEALNGDLRYQLTPLGSFSPLFVKSEVADGRFTIAGGVGGQRVCWQLTGVRKDAFANAHRIPVEEPKPAGERGLYLYPVEHGKPAEKGIGESRRLSRAPR